MHKRLVVSALLLFLIGGTAACRLISGPSSTFVSGPSATSEGIAAVVSANNQTTFDLYAQFRKSSPGNIFFSPYSISTALAMTYEGARGDTASETQRMLHFPAKSILEPSYAAIHASLNQKNASYKLETGNALWVQKNFRLLSSYVGAVQKYFGGKAANLDFATDPEKARITINKYVAEHTARKIKHLIQPGYIDQLTRLVLTNAIYFKGEWRWQFDRKETREARFTIGPGKTVKVPMMTMNPRKTLFKYADTDGMQILELPYKGGRLSMLILLPRKGLRSIARSLTADRLKSDLARMKRTNLDQISIPKFEMRIRYDLKKALKALGMKAAFSPSQADLSGMDGRHDLYVSFVLHQAYVKVDERGTEAAGATAVGMRVTSAGPSMVFRADHPFIFLIRDKTNGNILFFARVVDPTKRS